MKDNENEKYTKIRLGEMSDIPTLCQLNSKWQLPNLQNKDLKHGFLFGGIYSESDLEKIIGAGELAVLEVSGNVVGYYLFDNHSETETLKFYETIIQSLIAKGFLKTNRISKRAQAVIDRKFQNQGFSKSLLEFLISENSTKWDILFTVVSKKNPKIHAHVKGGWKILDEDDELYYVVYEFER